MRTKLLGLFGLSILLLALFIGGVSAVTLAKWPLTADGVADPATLNANVVAGNLAFGSSLNVIGTGFDITDGTVADGWNAVNPGPNDYYEVTLSPKSGFDLVINTVSFDHISDNATSDMKFDVEWSLDGFATTPTNLVSAGTSKTISALSSTTPTTSIAVSNGQIFSLRISGYDSDSSTEVFSVKNLILDGTVTLIPTPPLTEPPEVTVCNNIGNPGELRIKGIDFENLGSLVFKETSGAIYLEFGDDDEWFPLDNLEVELEIENNGDEDVDDVEVEWGIYNTKRSVMVIDFDEEDEVNIKDGDDEIVDVEFNLEDELDVDLDDLDDGKHYRFYVIATGDVDNATADRTCVADFEDLEIIIENDFVILDDVRFPETVQCGETIQITAKVWNIGEDDQDEVKVEIHNNDLGLFHRTVEIGDVDAFDDDTYTFNFRVPNDAEEKTHNIMFSVLDEDFDVYENDFDDDESEFSLPFRVSGGCSSAGADVSISAILESGGKAGESLTVRAIITNDGDELNTFIIRALGFSQWASSFNVDKSSLVLSAGDSAEVIFTFDVNNDASGSQSFTIELTSEENQVTTQPVSVAIEGKSGFLGRLTGGVISGSNAYLWGIGALNIILVIIIIIVAVRIARR